MLKKNLTSFWRKTKKNNIFTLINITGLSIGIAVFILITLWVEHEYSYDRFNKNLDEIYRIEIGGSVYMVSAIAQTFKNEFPEIEKTVRFSGQGSSLITHEDKTIYIENLVMADSTLFDIFTYHFIYGNARNALTAPYTIVLTRSTSERLFGNTDPTGKTLKVNNRYDAVITGVVEDVTNTHMPVDAIGSFVTLGKLSSQPDYLNSFGTSQYPTYFVIGKGVDTKALSERMTAFTIELSRKLGGSEKGNECELVPLREVYFHNPHFPRHLHGNLKFVHVFMIVSVLTLLMACINFINLTIAKSANVTREVGVKKVFGASQKQLFIQFLSESVVLCLVSSVLAVFLIKIIAPWFNQLTGGNISLVNYMNKTYLIRYFLFILSLGFLAGLYPAVKLSSFSPIKYFRQFREQTYSRSPFRTALVIFQFTVSLVLILSVFVVIRQLNYMKKFKTGFNSENVLVFRANRELIARRDAFKNELLQIPGIRDVAYSSASPGEVNNYEGFSYNGVTRGIPVFTIDPSYLPMLGIKISEGRNFSWERPNDRYGACILNREAVKLWEIENPEGKYLRHQFYLTTIPREEIRIIGVIDDYHYLSPKDSTGPALFCYGDWFNTVSIKANQENIGKTLKSVEKVYSRFAPGYPFRYKYLQESYESQYNTEDTLGKILVFFALLAVLIACLGLLGISSFLAQSKTREIGIRKVFGSSIFRIIKLLSSGFLKWVVMAIAAGLPVAVILMNKWLTNFAYHTTVSWWLILLSGLMLIVISLFTIIFHIVRVSYTNPVESLKYE
jgi:putative ABC transport system permease protein